jgi:hypothetical protein
LGVAKFLAVVVLGCVVALTVASATADDSAGDNAAAATCSAKASADKSALWSAALTLDELGQAAAAKEAAATGVQRTGGLPHEAATCKQIKELLAPESKSFSERLNQTVKDWWWLIAIAIFALIALAGYVVRRRWWRENRWAPQVSLQVADADADATGYDIGAQMGGLVRTQLLQLESKGVGPRVGYVSAADADVSLPPIDEVPTKVQWLVALSQWLGRRNRLSLTMTVAPSRSGRSQVMADVREPNGRTTIGKSQGPRQVVIERPVAGQVSESTYLHLTTPVAAWALFQLKEVTNETAPLRQEIGTHSWEAWAYLQDGVAALDEGNVDLALDSFESAYGHDSNASFFELRLNYAYALARSDDPELWERSLTELQALADATAP